MLKFSGLGPWMHIGSWHSAHVPQHDHVLKALFGQTLYYVNWNTSGMSSVACDIYIIMLKPLLFNIRANVDTHTNKQYHIRALLWISNAFNQTGICSFIFFKKYQNVHLWICACFYTAKMDILPKVLTLV